MSTYKQFVSEIAVSIWDATRAYKANDLVAHLGKIWRAKADLTPRAFAPADWEALGGGSISTFSPTAAYPANTIVSNLGVLYRANINNPGALNSGNWTVIGGGRSIAGTYVTGGVPAPTAGEDNDVVAVALPDHGPEWTPAAAATGLPTGQRGWDYSNPDYPGTTLRIVAIGSLVSATVGPRYDFILLGAPIDPPLDTITEITILDGSNNRVRGATIGPTTGGRKATVQLAVGDPALVAAFDAISRGTHGNIYTNAPTLPLYTGEEAFYARVSGAWQKVDPAEDFPIKAYKDNTSYQKDDLIIYQGQFYKANADIPGGPAFVPAEWASVVPTVAHPIDRYDATKSYAQDDIVIAGGKLYSALVTTTPGAFNTVQWREIGGDPMGVAVFDPTKTYNANDFVSQNGKIYRAKAAVTAKAFDPIQWIEHIPVPVGGAAGQILTKKTTADGDVVWQTPAAGAHPINKFDPAVGYAQDDLVIEAGEIYRAKAAVAAGAFDPTQWDKSVGGMNFAVLPSNDVGIEDDLISVAAASAPRDYTQRSATPAKDSARDWNTMYGLVNDLGGGNYVVIRTGPPPTVQMYIPSQATSPYPVGTLVSWDVDKFTWTSPIEVKHAKGAVPANFSGTPAEWDQLIDDLATDPPPLSHIDVYVGGVIRPAVQLYTKHNGSWENIPIDVGGEVDSIADSIPIRSAAGGIAAKGLSFFDGKDPIINYIDQAKHMRALSIGKYALKQVVGGTLPDRAGKDIVAIGEEAAARVTNAVLPDPNSGQSIVIGNFAAWFSTDIGYSAFVGHQAGAYATQSERSCFFGWHSSYKSTRTTMNDCTAIGYRALIPAGANGTIDKCTALGASAGAPPSSGNPAVESAEKTLCAGSSNVTLLGYGAKPTGDMNHPTKNEFVLGDHNVAKLRCKVTSITALSDERDKKDIADLGLGLDFINGLRPVSFEWDERGEGGYKGVKAVGFIAQEVLKAEKDSGMYDYLGMVSEDDPERLEMRTGELIPILTKAVQELSAEIEELKKEIAALKSA